MTAQDIRRAKFEEWVAQNHPAAPLDRIPSRPDEYDGILAAWTWAAWQAASTLPPALPEPVACIYKVRALMPQSFTVTHVALYRPLAAGTLLYAAAPAASSATPSDFADDVDLACARGGAAYWQSPRDAPR